MDNHFENRKVIFGAKDLVSVYTDNNSKESKGSCSKVNMITNTHSVVETYLASNTAHTRASVNLYVSSTICN